MRNPIKYITSNLAYIDPADSILKADCSVHAAAVHFSQPSVNYKGAYTIKKVDSGSNAVTIYAYDGETIDGAESVTLMYAGDYKTFAPVAGGWTVADYHTKAEAEFVKLNPVYASGVLSISNVAKDGETVTIGDDVYEFCADAAQSLASGSDYAIDIEAKTKKSTGTLTASTNPTAGEKLTIGPSGDTTEYTFVAAENFDAKGKIPLGANAAATQANIVKAINGTDGVNDPNEYVRLGAFNAAGEATVTALVGGSIGNAIGTTDDITGGFGAATLGGGEDCSAANAVTALVSAINANSAIATAADGDGDTVVVTAKAPGAAGNAIATTETMSNGAFAFPTLVGGSDQGLIAPLLTNITHEVTINTHDYEDGATDWTLSAAEQLVPYHKVVSASGAVNAIIPLTPSVPYVFINGSENTLTVKGAGGTGIEITAGKAATVMADGTNVIRLTVDA